MILRLPIHVTLFDEKGRQIQRFSSTKKSQVRLRVHGLSTGKRRSWAYGTCRVFYNRPNDFWNEFRFNSLTQLEAGLTTVTEKPLIDFLGEDIPEQYLTKRKLTPAQKRALKRARTKSPMKGMK